MDSSYVDTVRLLLTVAPDVFQGDAFAMKGGTAINLFVRDMPRLSVDIDVVYVPRITPRLEALAEISAGLDQVAQRLRRLGIAARKIGTAQAPESKLLIDNGFSQVIIEVNTIFRGTLLPVERRALTRRTADQFGMEFELPILAEAELYAGKFVAALDRQHPRDLFDVLQVQETTGITDAMIECFVVYLAGHNRPIHEVLFSVDKPVQEEYVSSFAGMAQKEVPVIVLEQSRKWLRSELTGRLTNSQRQFLDGMSRAEPDWSLIGFPFAADMPALRWKLLNLERFKERRPHDFRQQSELLHQKLAL